MNDMNLPFFMGSCEKLEECNIDTTPLRKSLDGTKAIIHMHLLTIDQFNAMRIKTSIEALTHEQARSLMATAEWSEII